MSGIPTNFPTDVAVQGTVFAQGFQSPNPTITDTMVLQAVPPVNASKLAHQHRITYAQATTATAVTIRQTIQVTYGAAGAVVAFVAGLAGTANVSPASITVDLLKNGTSILTAPISITTQAVRVLTSAGLASTGTVAGDVFEVNITATVSTGTLGTGLFAALTVNENPL